MGTAMEILRVPDIGDVGEVVVVEWFVDIDGEVVEGEDLVEVETEKTAFVVPSPVSGRLRAIRARAGEHLRIGETLGEIERE